MEGTVINALYEVTRILPQVLSRVDGEVTYRHGERHGSWFVQGSWLAGGILRSVEVGLTNATALQDSDAVAAVVTVQASASTNQKWVAHTLMESRRVLARLKANDVTNLLEQARTLANGFTPASLVNAYDLPFGE